MTITVDLRAAKIPFLGKIAVHYWFVINDADKEETQRWEIWQTQNCGDCCWGHLHFNLMKHDRGVGNGDSWLERQWQGVEAQNLAAVIRKTPHEYPYKYCYRYYPGPNSNTYVQWILEQAQINHRLSRRGLGKYYLKLAQVFDRLRNKTN